MIVIRKDGIGEEYSKDTSVRKFLLENAETHFAAWDGHTFITNVDASDIFVSNIDGNKMVKYIRRPIKCYTDLDRVEIPDEPFYLKGYFGINKQGQPITKIKPNCVSTQMGNTFRFFPDREFIKLLVVESDSRVSLKDIFDEAVIICRTLNGIGVTAGLCITPKSVGTVI